MELMKRNSKQCILNENLFKAIVRNDANDIIRLINLGADVNFEYTIEQLINLKLIDDNAIAKFKKSEVNFDELIVDGKPIRAPGPCKSYKAKYHVIDEEFTSIKRNNYSKLMIFPMAMNKIILSPRSTLSPLQLAIMYDARDSAIQLIKKGANPNKTLDVQNYTILQLMYTTAILKDKYLWVFDEFIIQLLFDHGADPNVQDVRGRSFLHFAVGSDFACRELIDRNCEIGMKIGMKMMYTEVGMKMYTDRTIETIHVYGDEIIIKRIERVLMNGTNPNTKEKYGTFRNVFYIMVELRKEPPFWYPNMINLFLDHGSIYCTNDDILKYPEEYCIEDVNKFNLEYRHYFVNNNRLIEAISSKDKSKVDILLSEGTSPNIRDKDGLSALHIAVKIGDYDIVELLLRKGANPNIKSWKNGTTPIFNAVVDNKIALVDLLAEYNANPSVMNTKLLSPLYFSVTANNEKMTKMLLVHGANPDISRQIFVLFDMLNGVKNDDHTKIIDNILNKIDNISRFLKSRDVPIDYWVFYQSADIAEKNNRNYIAKKVMELLDKLIPSSDC